MAFIDSKLQYMKELEIEKEEPPKIEKETKENERVVQVRGQPIDSGQGEFGFIKSMFKLSKTPLLSHYPSVPFSPFFFSIFPWLTFQYGSSRFHFYHHNVQIAPFSWILCSHSSQK